jgi:uncharacterized membrane protein YgcG
LSNFNSGEILDKFVIPNFKNANYDKGLLLGACAISAIIAKDAKITLDNQIIHKMI